MYQMLNQTKTVPVETDLCLAKYLYHLLNAFYMFICIYI